MKKIILLLSASMVFTAICAQKISSSKSKLVFTSFMGKSRTLGDIKDRVDNGTLTMTGLELQFKNHSSIYGELNFDGYGFKKRTATFSLDGSLNTIALTLGYKYRFTESRLSPYLKTGLGAAMIKYPDATVSNGFTTIRDISKLNFQFQASAGLVYRINKSYGVFIDAGFQQYSTRRYLQHNLSAAGLKIGVTSAF